jgi:hypothetical protein
MPKSVNIILTTIGPGVGPLMDLRSDADGFSSPFESNIPISSFNPPNGYLSTLVPDIATSIRVYSNGVCSNFINLILPSISPTPTPTLTPTPTTSLIPYSPRVTYIVSTGVGSARIVSFHTGSGAYFGAEVERRTGTRTFITSQPWVSAGTVNSTSDQFYDSWSSSGTPELIQYRVRIQTSATPTYSAWSTVPNNSTACWEKYISRQYVLLRVSNNLSNHCSVGVIRQAWVNLSNGFNSGNLIYTTPWSTSPNQVLTGYQFISVIGPGSGQIYEINSTTSAIINSIWGETCPVPNLPPYI